MKFRTRAVNSGRAKHDSLQRGAHAGETPVGNEDYLAAHREIDRDTFAGMRSVAIIQTGDRDFCLIGEWDDMAAIVAARPTMIATLDRSREMLEDLGGELGVTDPVSGEVVFEVHR